MMAALSETRPAAAPVLRRAPAAAGGRCSCGGTVGPDGMCDKCRQRAQRQAASAGATPALAPPAVHDVLRRPGAPLDGRVRSAMEPRFGHGFGDVRVHADGAAADSARAVSAHAYTVGPRIVFGAGRYAPGTPSGDRLIAHELAHVVQQRGSAPAIQHQLEIGAVDDPAERQADAAADQVMRGGRAEVRPGSAGTSLARQPAPSPAPSPAPAAPAATGASYPFKVTLNDCAASPFVEATVLAAARQAYDAVLNSNCIGSPELKEAILKEFNDLDIDCEQGDETSPCGSAHRYFTETINLFPKSMNPSRCGPLASTILHEVIHLTEWSLGGHGVLADACEKSCFGYGSGNAADCK